MVSFEERTIINGSMVKQFTGQLISIMLRVEQVAGTTLQASTTDNHKVRVSLPSGDLSAHPGEWVEVIGTPNSGDTIRSKEVIEFGGENIEFDTEGYNGMVNLMNNLKNIYRYG